MDKRSRVPADFKVSARVIELAKQHGWPDPLTEVDQFIDYHLAHGTLMLDWEAAFRTWMRNAKRYADDKAARVYTRDPRPIRRVEDRRPIGFLRPADTIVRLDEKKLAEGRSVLMDTVKKLASKLTTK